MPTRMRRRIVFAAALTLAIVAAAAAETTRSPGAYAVRETAGAAAFARACAEDGICMAWTFQREHRCELSAVVPGRLDPNAQAAGFAARAPALLRVPAPAPAAAPIVPQTETAAIGLEAAEPAAPVADHGELLGGPAEGDLRL